MIRKFRTAVCDFETTVYEGQEYTEVWAAAFVYLDDLDNQIVFNSIEHFFNFIFNEKGNLILYFHNLKFDGNFILAYLMDILKWNQAADETDPETPVFYDDGKMKNKTFKYTISDMGQWYTITLRQNDRIIRIQDSLKLIPRSVKQMGKDFGTKHRKTEIEYEGFRYAGGEISEEETEYIKNDILVVAESLEYMLSQGHDRLTIGACCLAEFKTLVGKDNYAALYPNLYKLKLIPGKYDAANVGDYIHKAYRGGWCYVKEGCEGKEFKYGVTCDVNSLYPSVMSGESYNLYPYGVPMFFKGEIPKDILAGDYFYYVRIKTRFYLKPGKLPFIQVKGDLKYKSNDMLKSSDVRLLCVDPDGTKYYKTSRFYKNLDGETVPARVELTLTMMDYKLFLEHYNVEDFEILDGCYFKAAAGMFDDYIEKYKNLKITATTPGIRVIAKLFLNNLYGKFAASMDSSFKFAYLNEDRVVKFRAVESYDKIPGYIAVGAAVTSYARCFTIRAAQKNYDAFVYADTDSIHCSCSAEEIKGIKIHDKNFLCWKIESYWDYAKFLRQKTYVEHVTHEDGNQVERPYYNIKCAGMPQRCKDLLLTSITGDFYKDGKILVGEEKEKEYNKLAEDEKEFIGIPRNWHDFEVGLKVPGKLLPETIRGGVVLKHTDFEIRNNVRYI